MIGQRLGPYEITAKLGEGGMGQVFQAKDFHLGRNVALKVLPEGFTQDPERLARFEREAKLLAQLNHPNIAQIYGLETSGDTRALVMELVEGPTLAERLEQGPLPFNECLSVSLQIAQALEEAHDKGIVHRDLKPQNIKASDEGKVKVLDFGLAKAMEISPASTPSAQQLAQSPTLTFGATQMGMILGTAAYMSPEQAAGKLVDRRTDIWAFGVVLWEMLSGRRLFEAESVPETLGAVFRQPIDFGALPTTTPPPVRLLVERCLERDPKARLRDIGEARIALQAALESSARESRGRSTLSSSGAHSPAGGVATSGAERAARVGWLPWAIAALAIAVASALALVGTSGILRRGERPPAARPLTVFGVLVPPEHFLPRSEIPLVDLSDDGRTLLFVAEGQRGRSVFRRSFDRLAVQRVEGTEGADQPQLSPDGRWIAFFSGGMLRKVPVEGGVSAVVAEARAPRGASWAPDGSIVYSPVFNSALYRVAASGGTPAVLTTLDAAKGERSHRWPQVLPGGRAVLFTVGLVTSPGDYDGAEIQVARIDTGERRVVARGARMARYTAAGYLVYQRGATLLAVRFDATRLETTGEPFTVQEGVGGDSSSGSAYFDVSADGVLALAPEAAIPNERALVLVDRNGAETELAAPPAAFNQPRFSPDGRRITFAVGSGSSADDDVYVFELATGRLQRLTFGQGHGAPNWSADGALIVYTNGRSGETGLLSKRADGGGEEAHLHKTPGVILANAWLPGGRGLIVTDAQGTLDVRVLDLAGGGVLSPLFASTAAAEYGAALSPDGRYIAYTSTETGTDEIFVETFPPGRGKWQVSAAGGLLPVWSRDGRELYFVAGESLMGVAVETGEVFRAGVPRPLFSGPYQLRTSPWRNYDVGPDGRFLLVKRRFVSSTPRELVVLEGWAASDPARTQRR